MKTSGGQPGQASVQASGLSSSAAASPGGVRPAQIPEPTQAVSSHSFLFSSKWQFLSSAYFYINLFQHALGLPGISKVLACQ